MKMLHLLRKKRFLMSHQKNRLNHPSRKSLPRRLQRLERVLKILIVSQVIA
jgi:hypothetical protein